MKQGCPLSVILFCLYIEMLAHYITAHDNDCRTRLYVELKRQVAECAQLGDQPRPE